MFDVERKRLLSLCHHTTLMLRPTGCHVTVCNGALRAHTCLRQSGQTIWAARPGFILKCLSFLLLAPFHGHCTVPLPYGRPFLARTSRLPSWAFALAVCNQCSLCSSTRSCTRRPMHLTPHVTSTAKSLYLSVSSNAPSDSNRRWAALIVQAFKCVHQVLAVAHRGVRGGQKTCDAVGGDVGARLGHHLAEVRQALLWRQGVQRSSVSASAV